MLSFINQIEIPSCVVKLNGEILSFNDGFKNLFFQGFDGTSNNLLAIFYNKEDYLNIIKNIKNINKSKKIQTVRYKTQSQDGEEKNIFADTYFNIAEYETKPYMLFHFYDVTKHINNQMSASEYIKNVELSQGEEYRRLLKEKISAEEKNSVKSSFLAAVSHELRTPLNSILGFAELLIDETKRIPELNEKLNFIYNEGKRLTLIINDILDFSKISDNKLELHYEFFSIDDLIIKLKNLFDSRCRDKNIDFKIICDPEMPKFLNGDLLRILQIMINLIGNAIKFTPSGHIAIQFSYDTKSCVWKIIVKDTGIGVPEEFQKKIFSPFEQTDGSVQKKYGGTGLGLSITLNLVKLMRGNIFIESKLNEGTAFIIKLPLVFKRTYEEVFSASLGPATIDNLEIDEKSAKEEIKRFSEKIMEPDGGVKTGKQEKKVLIVDDNPQILKLLTFILSKSGCEVIKAVNGSEALLILEHTKNISLVFMDLMMPEMDGFTAIKNIRNIEKFNDIPVVAVSAKNIPKKEAINSGFNDFIKKPFTRPDILETLKKFIPDVCDPVKSNNHIQKVKTNNSLFEYASENLERIFLEESQKFDWTYNKEVISIVNDFLLDLPSKINRLSFHINNSNSEGTRFETHSLKGISGYLSLKALECICDRIDELNIEDTENVAKANKEISLLKQYYGLIIDYFNNNTGLELKKYDFDRSKRTKKAGNAKAIIAEDDAISRRFIEILFKKFDNIDLTICDSGEELIEKTGKEKFDLIFTDIHLKGMSGIEAAKIIREKINDTSPLIALTGSSGDGEINFEEAKKYFNEWLQKPVSIKELETIIKKYV